MKCTVCTEKIPYREWVLGEYLDVVFCVFCDCPLCVECDDSTDFGNTCNECWAKVAVGLINEAGVDRSRVPYQRRNNC